MLLRCWQRCRRVRTRAYACVRACVRNTCALHGKQVDNAFKMLVEMRRANCAPDKITYSTLIKACVAKGQVLMCVCV